MSNEWKWSASDAGLRGPARTFSWSDCQPMKSKGVPTTKLESYEAGELDHISCFLRKDYHTNPGQIGSSCRLSERCQPTIVAEQWLTLNTNWSLSNIWGDSMLDRLNSVWKGLAIISKTEVWNKLSLKLECVHSVVNQFSLVWNIRHWDWSVPM